MSTPSTSTIEPGAQYRVLRTSAINGVRTGSDPASVSSEAEGLAISTPSEAAVVAAVLGACFDMGSVPSRRRLLSRWLASAGG